MDGPANIKEMVESLSPTELDDLLWMLAFELSFCDLSRIDAHCSNPFGEKDAFRQGNCQNITEYVAVPSSEHVAEIVGRKGRKIRALREETNTYIKTPARDEEPVFVVVGRSEDVAMARNVILTAAKHFTKVMEIRNKSKVSNVAASIRALEKPTLLSTNTLSQDLPNPGFVTLKVHVPYRAVVFVVGPEGVTLETIQRLTHTHIVITGSERDPIFEVTGFPENAEKAKDEIRALVDAEIGIQSCDADDDDDFARNGTVVETSLPNFLEFQSAFTPQETRDDVGETDIFSLPKLENPSFRQLRK